MADIFLSYARADQPRIEQLAAALEDAGYSVWWDRHIDGGAEFSADIERELEAAKTVIVAWSKDSTASRWVRDEASVALEFDKLIAISLDGTAPPLGFKQIHTIDMRGHDGEADLKRSLANKLGKVSDAPPAPKAKKSNLPILVGSAAAIALLGAGGYFLTQHDEPVAVETTAASNSVAVLPFTSLSSDEEDSYFADGLTEEIMTALDTLPDLLVTARSSAFFFQDKDIPLTDIGQRLGVEHIVEGTVRRSGDRLRVTAELVRAADGVRLWSNAYDAEIDDLVSVQVDIAEQVAAALDILLDEQERTRMAESGTSNVEAYRHYSKGNELFRLAHGGAPQIETLQLANEEYAKAIELSPDMWAAYFASADLYSHAMLDFVGQTDDARDALIERAPRRHDELMRNAARFAPDQVARDLIEQARLIFSNNWTGLAEISDDALEIGDSCSFDQWLHFSTIPFGRADDAVAFYRQQALCSPIDESSWGHAAVAAIWAGKPELALELNDRARVVSDGTPRGIGTRADILIALGRFEDARALMQSQLDQNRIRSGFSATEAIGASYAAEGNREKLDEVIADLEQAVGDRDAENASLFLFLAARGGDREEANRLASIIDQRIRGSVVLMSMVHFCMCGAPFDLEATPNFARQLSQSGLPWPPASPINWPLKDW